MAARAHRPARAHVTLLADRIPGVQYNADGVAVDATGEPLSKNALKKAAKAAQIAAKKAQKAQLAASEQSAGAAQEGSDVEEPAASFRFVDAGIMQSTATPEERQRRYTPIADLGTTVTDGEVWVRGRVAAVRAQGRRSCFLVLRAQGRYTVQAIFFAEKQLPKQSKAMLAHLSGLTSESIVDIRGVLVPADVKSCTQSNVELQIQEVALVSRADPMLPFEIADAGRSEAEIAASEGSERPYPRIGQDLRLNSRWIDLRVPASHAILRTQSAICTLFRQALLARGFVEIHTPKLVAGESEGGADVFRTDYFGSGACLAQSPQLYKQMAIAADMDRVFEIGPVFRAEKSNSRRHLCEFTGLDLEMGINQHYHEVIDVVHSVFTSIFAGLEQDYAAELASIRAQYPSERPRWTPEPLIVTWDEACELLTAVGESAPELDLNTAQERALGRAVAEKYGTEFFFLDRFPAAARPFYTMPSDGGASNSFDIFLRGEEICSGAQRVHDPGMLEAAIAAKGLPLAPLEYYVDSMRHGMPPHGGCGFGLERVVFLYLGLDNVRKASMFPRDPSRCTP